MRCIIAFDCTSCKFIARGVWVQCNATKRVPLWHRRRLLVVFPAAVSYPDWKCPRRFGPMSMTFIPQPARTPTMSTKRRAAFVVSGILLASLMLLTWRGDSPRAAAQPQPAAKLELRPGDHICIIGNTLADRMQHDGWLEAYLYSRFPKHDLVIRNLGFSGDELTLRLRSMDFGTPDQWLAGAAPIPQPRKLNADAPVRLNRFELTNTKADVVFAFFGYNESFAGAAGLEKFKKDLDAFIKHTLSQKYNGTTAPRLVLFSPTFHEKLLDRNLPSPAENNKRLALYTKAMGQVASANGVPFVDLFNTTMRLERGQPMTINGVHLNEYGNMLVASIIDRALFGERDKRIDAKHIERIRQAVIDKNEMWYQRYRTVDGYSTYGDRAFLRFVGGQ